MRIGILTVGAMLWAWTPCVIGHRASCNHRRATLAITGGPVPDRSRTTMPRPRRNDIVEVGWQDYPTPPN